MTFTINRLGHHGDGIADGPVFAPMTLPGEVIDGELDGDRIAAPKIVTPSADRVRPPCPHFKACGGCALQHASDAFVEVWKQQVVRDALAAHDLPAPIRNVHTSPPNSRRRAVFSGRRTKKGATVGFHGRASTVIVEIAGCTLLIPQLVALVPTLKNLVIIGASRKAELDFTVNWSESGADVSVTGGKPADHDLRQDLGELVSKQSLARLTWDAELIAQNKPPVQDIMGIQITPPPGAFLQATKQGETALVKSVMQSVSGTRRVLDLFAGCGTFSLPMARQAEIHAVESSAKMLTALDAAWRGAQGLKSVTTEARDLFRRPMVPEELGHYDAVVIDPPRAGAKAQVAELAASNLQRITMVSCNPASFAHDAKILVGAGFGLDWIDVVDQFRWSAHVELAAQFTRP